MTVSGSTIDPISFAHEPLKDPANEFRLVRLDRSDEDSDIVCMISAFSITNAPSYIAVSYAWGDAANRRSIQINGKHLSLGYNSWEVLWQVRLHQPGGLLWMDMLCIDQTNDVEKSIQVGMMGEIFKTAAVVYAGVGSHADDSKFLIERIRSHALYIKQRRQIYREAGSEVEDGAHSGHVLHKHDDWGPVDLIEGYKLTVQMNLETVMRFSRLPKGWHQRTINALRAFSLRIYFTRLWVVQELRLARQIIIICGDSTLRFDELQALAFDVQRSPDGLAVPHQFEVTDGMLVSWQLGIILNEDDTGSPISDLVYNYSDWQCTDARDRVFALLALADQDSLRAIVPDYTQSPTSVLVQLLRQVCLTGVFDLNVGVLMDEAFVIISQFRLGPDDPENASLLRARREYGCTPQLADVLKSRELDAHCDNGERMRVGVKSFCVISDAKSGELQAPLRRETDPQYKQGGWHEGVSEAFLQASHHLHDHSRPIHHRGRVVAVAGGTPKPGDTVLSFGNNKAPWGQWSGLHTPNAGLVVRALTSEQYFIVGQVLFDLEMEPYTDPEYTHSGDRPSDNGLEGREAPLSGQGVGGSEKQDGPILEWEVHFAPEDILLFVVQDLEFHERRKGEGRALMVDRYVRPADAVKRLETCVTSSVLSSYAICRKRGKEPAS